MKETFPTAEVKKNTKQIAEDFACEVAKKEEKGEYVSKGKRLDEFSFKPDFKLNSEEIEKENKSTAESFLRWDSMQEYVEPEDRKKEADLFMSKNFHQTQENIANKNANYSEYNNPVKWDKRKTEADISRPEAKQNQKDIANMQPKNEEVVNPEDIKKEAGLNIMGRVHKMQQSLGKLGLEHRDPKTEAEMFSSEDKKRRKIDMTGSTN